MSGPLEQPEGGALRVVTHAPPQSALDLDDDALKKASHAGSSRCISRAWAGRNFYTAAVADRCPQCSELMYRRTVLGVETNGCPGCGGVWLDAGELQQLARQPGGVRTLLDTFKPGPPRAAAQRLGQCIRCQAPLAPFEYDAFRGVRMELCRSCKGLFAGRAQLEAIAERLSPMPPADAPPAGQENAALERRFTSIADPQSALSTSGPFWDELRATDAVLIHQRFEPGELFGFETRNKYDLSTERGPFGFAAEQGKGVFGFLARQYLGHWRTFDLVVFDLFRRVVLNAHHPFRWFFSRLEITLPDGRLLGALQQRFSLLHKRFDVEDARGQVLMTVESPLWRPWTFPFLKGGAEVGLVTKRWSGFFTEAFTDKDRFLVQLSAGASQTERALLIAAGLFIDLQYFERKASRN